MAKRLLSIAIRQSGRLVASNDLPVIAAAYSFYSNRKLGEIMTMPVKSIKFSMEVAYPLLEKKVLNPMNDVKQPIYEVCEYLEEKGWSHSEIAYWVSGQEIKSATCIKSK